jgi:hypothetical protein
MRPFTTIYEQYLYDMNEPMHAQSRRRGGQSFVAPQASPCKRGASQSVRHRRDGRCERHEPRRMASSSRSVGWTNHTPQCLSGAVVRRCRKIDLKLSKDLYWRLVSRPLKIGIIIEDWLRLWPV